MGVSPAIDRRRLTFLLVALPWFAGLLTSCATVPTRPTLDPASAPRPAAGDARAEDGLARPAEPGSEHGDSRGAPEEPEAEGLGDDAAAQAHEEEQAQEQEEAEIAEDDFEVFSAPHDDLERNPPEPSPEEIERERAIAAQQAPAFDIPMVVNEKVTAWVDFYSGPHKEKFEMSLARSGRYLEMVQRTFREAGIPTDLAYMAHVESAFKPRAYSRAKAKGIFQFIAATGRRYGLRSDAWTDDRSDPEKSARAAAAYLTDLHDEFGDWYLALAGYNAGEGKIRRAIAKTGSRDFWTIARTSAIRNETKNYVPAILAATLIAKDPARYGLAYTPDEPIVYELAEVRGGLDLRALAQAAGLAPDALYELNPDLRRARTAPGRMTNLKVPPGFVAATVAAAGRVPAVRHEESARHVVRKGDTLGAISRRYGVSVAAIQRANRLGSPKSLPIGKVLRIPSRNGASGGGDDVDEPAAAATATTLAYRVRSGDTLSAIARRHGTSPAAIASASGIGVHRTLRVGETLRIPARASRAKGPASRPGPVVHTVRRGDTLANIAARYRISVDRICSLNDLSRSETIYPGTKLTIR